MGILKFFESIRSGALTALFSGFTFLGEENFIVLAVIIIYFALNKKFGQLMAFSVFSAAAINCIIKALVARERPYLTGEVTRVELTKFISTDLANSFSFPSGHAQIAAAFFGLLFLYTRSKLLKSTCIVVVLMVMLSRLYLGVHYLSDVLIGAILGVLCALFWKFIDRFNYNEKKIFLLISVALCAFIIFIKSENLFKALGASLGAGVGIVLESRFIGFKITNKMLSKILAAAAAILLAAILRYILKALLPNLLIFSFIRYFILTLFLTLVCPVIFFKAKKIDNSI